MGVNQCTWIGDEIETPLGIMTRAQAAKVSGLPKNTIIRRVWQLCPPEHLFKTARELRELGCLDKRNTYQPRVRQKYGPRKRRYE